ncbi:MAG TPA: 30S ribosomal protein S6 [Candidatus Kapabacteria bacterium]|nr:30S ribosomal protein S6 [Candidatus Kapabacteria bacterium]
MQQYELLCILPGTLAETDVPPVVDAIAAVITTNNGKILSMDDMGKSRLAYPMKHIRYGYFRVCRFEAEPKDLPEMQKKLRLMHQLLRALITKVDLRAPEMKTIQFASTVIRDSAEEGMPMAKSEERTLSPVAGIKEEDVVAPVAEKKEEKKNTLEDIDKRLDEILEEDLAKDL